MSTIEARRTVNVNHRSIAPNVLILLSEGFPNIVEEFQYHCQKADGFQQMLFVFQNPPIFDWHFEVFHFFRARGDNDPMIKFSERITSIP
jgi:hypothetical protein